ncbi:hypothetical protein [Shewanella sp. MSW]|uniref:hypothetical protein n=1 Tax=Shewanella sp. MSW TaxID=2569536 RepID=UPI00118662DC|nr:hypothetical protein [Shewanella sp. MSW]TVP09802.1 hypothetical protein AYI96_15160 [Shewanella sp. MSW]
MNLDQQILLNELATLSKKLVGVVDQLEQCLMEQLEEHEELARVLHELVFERQKLIEQLVALPLESSQDALEQQHQLTLDIERRISVVRKAYADTLITLRGNDRKLNVYRSLDFER